jgi:hypothetical protein
VLWRREWPGVHYTVPSGYVGGEGGLRRARHQVGCMQRIFCGLWQCVPCSDLLCQLVDRDCLSVQPNLQLLQTGSLQQL